jgi:hypothetical protein
MIIYFILFWDGRSMCLLLFDPLGLRIASYLARYSYSHEQTTTKIRYNVCKIGANQIWA